MLGSDGWFAANPWFLSLSRGAADLLHSERLNPHNKRTYTVLLVFVVAGRSVLAGNWDCHISNIWKFKKKMVFWERSLVIESWGFERGTTSDRLKNTWKPSIVRLCWTSENLRIYVLKTLSLRNSTPGYLARPYLSLPGETSTAACAFTQRDVTTSAAWIYARRDVGLRRVDGGCLTACDPPSQWRPGEPRRLIPKTSCTRLRHRGSLTPGWGNTTYCVMVSSIE